MKKTPLITLATAAAIAGVGAATSSNQVAAATTSTTTKAPDATTTAEQNVQAAQTAVDTAKTQATQATQTKQTAAQDLAASQQASDQAQAKVDDAKDIQAKATPEAIQQAQSDADDAQATQADAEKTVDTAQTAVDKAQQAATDAQASQKTADDAVTKAQTDVDDAQKQVTAQTPVTTQQAQQAVADAQATVDTDTKANDQAQQAATKADTAVDTAQQSVTQSQATVDKTTATVKAQQGTGGLEMPDGYLAAVNENVKIPDDATDAQRNAILENDNLVKAKKQITMLGYTATDADKAEKIADITNLTQAQTRELSEFAASVLNDIRQQMGLSALHVTDGSVTAASLVATEGDASLYQFYGNPSGYDINSDFSQEVAKAAGISIGRSDSYEDDDGKTVVEVYGDGSMEDVGSQWGWDLSDGDKSATMFGLKAGVVAYLGMMFTGTNYATNDGIITATGAWRSASNHYLDGEPDMVTSLLLGEGTYNDPNTEKPYDYLGVTVDSKGQLRFILQDMTGVSKSEAYFNNTTTPAAIAHPTDTKAASQLATQQAALAKAQQALTDAKMAQTKATKAKTAAAAKLAASQATLQAAQTALTQAQKIPDSAALTQAKAALADAQTKLSAAQANAAQVKIFVDATYQTLAEKQADATAAQKALETAQAAVKQAQAWLSALQNADANVQAAQDAFILAQREVIAAQIAYDKTVAPAQSASDQLTAALAKLKAAQTQLTTIKQQQAQVDAVQLQVRKSATSAQPTTPIKNQSAPAKTMPQAGETNQSSVFGLAGAALLSLIGFGAYSLKKRA